MGTILKTTCENEKALAILVKTAGETDKKTEEIAYLLEMAKESI
jgi:hypothetical protein